jgi:hypothetical protein
MVVQRLKIPLPHGARWGQGCRTHVLVFLPR